MNSVIIYNSKYGSTKQHAQWISEAFDADIFDEHALKNFSDYETVIFGSGVYYGKIKISGYIKKNWEELKDKNIILYSVSGSPSNGDEIKGWYVKSLPESIRSKIKFFSLDGQTVWNDLSLFHKLLVRVIKKRSEDIGQIDKDYIKPIVEYLNGMQEGTESNKL